MTSNNGQWTREDLPSVMDLVKASVDATAIDPSGGADAALDAVVAHLNTHHPKPEFEGYCTCNGYDSGGLMGDCGIALHRAQYRADRAESNVDRWRRAHGIVEQERDQAREQIAEWKARAEQAENARDTAATRAKQLEREVSKVEGRASEWSIKAQEWQDRATLAEQECKNWRITAINRAAPAVTRADVERVVHRYIDGGYDELHASRVKSTTDAFMALLSGDDPAVYVVRESDVAAVEVQAIDGGKWWLADGALVNTCESPTESEAQEAVDDTCAALVGALAVRRAIEAEAAVDPVEAKARVEADRRYSGDPNHAFIEGAVWATRHLNEQEAGDE